MCVKLMLKWPNLYFATSGFAPRHYRRKSSTTPIRAEPNKFSYAGYWPVLAFEKLYEQLALLPLRDHVWPKFFRENTRRVFQTCKQQ